LDFPGEQLIALPQAATWDALNNTEVLMDCIPGCDSIDKQSDNEYLLTMTAKVGPVSAKFKGKMTLSEINPPDSYTLHFEGQGGVAGFAKGGAVVTLTEDGGDTILKYEVDAQVGGKIAQVGARLITGTAKKLADQFFGKFAESVGAPPPVAAAS
jgi:carbon monoxide dehydrogenase subunit G